jgi:hypothetical protein
MSTTATRNTASPAGASLPKIVRGIAAAVLFSVCGGILALAMSNGSAANRDFISYWAAGQSLVHHADPYNASAIFALEKSVGLRTLRPLIIRNPPCALFLTIPLGFMSEKTGMVLWSLLILASLMLSIHLLRGIQGDPPNRLHLLGYLFAPSLACLLAGQTSAFALLGLTLFFYFHRTRPWLAGAALLFCALKPHIILPFGVALISWIVVQKAYRVLAGAALALGISCVVPLLFDSSVYSHYVLMARTSGVETEFVPTLSEIFRIALNSRVAWLQFLPAVAGCLWALWYFRKYRDHWDWQRHGALLMLLSLLVAPYCWFTDEVVLLPAIFHAIYAGDASPGSRSLLWFAAIDGLALIEVLCGVQMYSGLYVWTPAAWVLWYLCFMRDQRSSAMLSEAV